MERYEKYKDSRVEWIGEIPEGWKIKKLKYLAKISLGKMLTNNDKGDYKRRKYLRAANIEWLKVSVSDVKEMWFSDDEIKRLRLVKNDLLVSEGGDVGRTCLWKDELKECYIQNSVHKITFNEKNNSEYFLYQFLVMGNKGFFNSIVNRISIAHLTGEKLKKVNFICPPIEEQVIVANYLNKKTTEIDQLIAQKERLLSLYEEEKKATINQAVTQGINPDVKLKESGIDWLGEIPEHWKVKKLKYVATMIGGYAFSSKVFTQSGVQLIKIANLYQNKLRLERQPTFLPSEYINLYPQWVVRKNDILISMTGTLGKRDYGFAIILDKNENYLLNQRVAKVGNLKGVSEKIIIHILRSEYFLNNLFSTPAGTKQGNLSNEQFLDIKIAYPCSYEEQTTIVQYIKAQTTKINTKITKTKKIIALQKEYRTALISEVVTGKVKVPQEITP